MQALQGNGQLDVAIMIAVVVMAFGRAILRAVLGILAIVMVAALGIGAYAMYHAAHF